MQARARRRAGPAGLTAVLSRSGWERATFAGRSLSARPRDAPPATRLPARAARRACIPGVPLGRGGRSGLVRAAPCRRCGSPGAAVYERAGRRTGPSCSAIALLGDRGPRAPRPLLDAAYPAPFPPRSPVLPSGPDFDPYLVLAVMRRESLFKPDTRSAAGAVGLLQLLPATARRAAVVLRRPPLRRTSSSSIPAPPSTWHPGTCRKWSGASAIPPSRSRRTTRARAPAAPWAIRGAGRPLDEWVETSPTARPAGT